MRFKRKYWISGLGLLAALVLVVLAFGAIVYEDRAYVCSYTGSRHGYRLWFTGLRTGSWERQSPLEDFLKREAPDSIKHLWKFSSGTGHNIFGSSILFSDGAAGVIRFLKNKDMKRWIDHNDPKVVREFYELLCSGDSEASYRRVKEIIDKVAAY